jgi:hypothetical protein
MDTKSANTVYAYKIKAWLLVLMLIMTLLAALMASTQGLSYTTKSGQPIHPAMWVLLGVGLVGWVIHCAVMVYDLCTGGKQVVLTDAAVEVPQYFGKRRTTIAYTNISKLAFGHKGILWIFTPNKRYGVHRSLFANSEAFEDFLGHLCRLSNRSIQ